MRLLRSLQWRIALAYTALLIISMGVVSLYLINFVRNSYISDLQVRLEHEAGLIGQTTTPHLTRPLEMDSLQATSEQIGDLVDARITIIAIDGTVLADTWEDPSIMESHIGRPEVQAALQTGLGQSSRLSSTVEQEMLYVAVPIQLDDNQLGVARVAVPTSQIQANVNRIIATVFFSALIVTALSVLLAYFLARQTLRSVRSVTEGARRLAAGDLVYRVQPLAADETQELAATFNRMAAALTEMIGELSSERNKLSAILDTMEDAVIVTDQNGAITLLNRAAEGVLNVEADEVAGARFIEVFRDHDLQLLVSRCLQTREQQYGEAELLRPRRFISAIATPLVDHTSLGVLLTMHDLTRIRQTETTRREFVSNVSHELRSPLASIKAMVETLEDGAVADPQVAADFLRRINRDIDRMNSMVEDLLELSRLESGQQEIHLSALDLRSIIEDVLRELHSEISAKAITVVPALPDGLPRLLAEEERLRQVMVNLLSNAVKFTPEGGEVTVAAKAEDESVEVRVSDTGIGIAPEHLPHVFERFYKVERSRRDGGTGLGLAIVKHIVQVHGGEVRVESREGEGSTFVFTMPIAH